MPTVIEPLTDRARMICDITTVEADAFGERADFRHSLRRNEFFAKINVIEGQSDVDFHIDLIRLVTRR
jgi:hypothetical protein